MDKAPFLASNAVRGFVAGAVTGATLASLRSLKKIRENEITPQDAAKEIIKDSAVLGTATGIGFSTVSLLGLTGLVSIAGIALVTAGTKYGIETALEKEHKHLLEK